MQTPRKLCTSSTFSINCRRGILVSARLVYVIVTQLIIHRRTKEMRHHSSHRKYEQKKCDPIWVVFPMFYISFVHQYIEFTYKMYPTRRYKLTFYFTPVTFIQRMSLQWQRTRAYLYSEISYQSKDLTAKYVNFHRITNKGKICSAMIRTKQFSNTVILVTPKQVSFFLGYLIINLLVP